MKLICSLGHCECDGHTVHMLIQRRLTADWLAPRESVHGCTVRSPLTGSQVISRSLDQFSKYSKWLDTFWTALVYTYSPLSAYQRIYHMSTITNMATYRNMNTFFDKNTNCEEKIKMSLSSQWRHIWWQSRGTDTPILNLGARWRFVVKFTPRPIYTRERNPVPTECTVGMAPQLVWKIWGEEIKFLYLIIFIVAPCILKIHWVLHINECTSYILYICLKFTLKHLKCPYMFRSLDHPQGTRIVPC